MLISNVLHKMNLVLLEDAGVISPLFLENTQTRQGITMGEKKHRRGPGRWGQVLSCTCCLIQANLLSLHLSALISKGRALLQ